MDEIGNDEGPCLGESVKLPNARADGEGDELPDEVIGCRAGLRATISRADPVPVLVPPFP